MTLKNAITLYLQELAVLNRASGTIRTIKIHLNRLSRFLQDQSINDVEQLTADVLSDYQQELSFTMTAKGAPLSIGTQIKMLCVARGLTRFLMDKDYLASDPGRAIRLPKTVKRLPKVILSHKEVKALVNTQDMRSRFGYRRRMIIEILYDTGIRRGELVGLKLIDIDLNAGYLHIRNGKGGKDRVVPVSDRVCKLIHNYMLFVRPTFIRQKDPGNLVVNIFGDNIGVNGIYMQVLQAVESAGIKKNITPHTLRHTCATHMLRNGAPVRHIQELLGHASLNSTQVYTRVTINDLKKIHAQYHPGEKMT